MLLRVRNQNHRISGLQGIHTRITKSNSWVPKEEPQRTAPLKESLRQSLHKGVKIKKMDLSTTAADSGTVRQRTLHQEGRDHVPPSRVKILLNHS